MTKISHLNQLYRLQLFSIILLFILTACSTNGSQLSKESNSCSSESPLVESEILKYIRSNSVEVDSLINKKVQELNMSKGFSGNIRIGGLSFIDYMPASKLNISVGIDNCMSEVFYTMTNKSELNNTKAYIAKNFYEIRESINNVFNEYLERGGYKNLYSISSFHVYDVNSLISGLNLASCCQSCDRRACGGGWVTCCSIACGCCSR